MVLPLLANLGVDITALVFEAFYYVLSLDYSVHMDVQQAILLAIYRRFEEEGIDFAFPRRTVYVHREPVEDAA